MRGKEEGPMTDETPVAEADAAVTTVDASATPEADAQPSGPSESEANALRRAAEAERKAKRLEAEAKKREEDEAAAQGEFQKLAEQRAAELEAERGERTRMEREARITRLAQKAKFLDPNDVIGRISAEQGADDASVEAALESIAANSPHLVAKEAPAVPEIGVVHTPSATTQTGPQPPAGKAPLRTQADVEALSDKEFEARYAEVQAVLRSPAQ